MSAARHLTATLLLLTLMGCGTEPASPSELPTDPAQAARWVFMPQDEDNVEFDRRLELWPHDATHFAGDATSASHTVISQRLRRRLGRGDLDAAKADFDYVTQHHAGRLSDGTSASLVREGFVHRAVELAREWLEGATPRLDDARRAAALAQLVQGSSPATDDDPLPALERWVRADQVKDLGLPLAHHDGPRVIAVLTDFALGEVILPQVLRRWARDLGTYGLRVEVLPLRMSMVRVGMRAQTAPYKEVLASMRQRLAGSQVHVDAKMVPMLHLRERFGASPCALFVVDRSGRIVARMTGVTIDPQQLNDVVHRVATR